MPVDRVGQYVEGLPQQPRVEHEAGVGGVVVGHEDEGPVGRRIAGLRPDVLCVAAWQQAPKELWADGHVVRGRGSRQCADGRAEHAAAEARRDCSRLGQPDRPPVRAVRPLPLDNGLQPEVAQVGRYELCCPSLAVGARAALKRRELLDPLAKTVLIEESRGQGAGTLQVPPKRSVVDVRKHCTIS